MVEALHMVMDVSVTEANLNNASFQWGCNLATHCSVFVQLCLRKAHLFSGVEGSTQSVTEAKGEGLGTAPGARAYNFKLEAHDGETIIIFSYRFSSVAGSKDDMTYNKKSQVFKQAISGLQTGNSLKSNACWQSVCVKWQEVRW